LKKQLLQRRKLAENRLLNSGRQLARKTLKPLDDLEE
jgi:hypothetical protein